MCHFQFAQSLELAAGNTGFQTAFWATLVSFSCTVRPQGNSQHSQIQRKQCRQHILQPVPESLATCSNSMFGKWNEIKWKRFPLGRKSEHHSHRTILWQAQQPCMHSSLKHCLLISEMPEVFWVKRWKNKLQTSHNLYRCYVQGSIFKLCFEEDGTQIQRHRFEWMVKKCFGHPSGITLLIILWKSCPYWTGTNISSWKRNYVLSDSPVLALSWILPLVEINLHRFVPQFRFLGSDLHQRISSMVSTSSKPRIKLWLWC